MMKKEYEPIEIIEDSESEEAEENVIINKPVTKIKRVRDVKILKKCYNEDKNILEIGVDEVGRGPLFGRVYTAAVILPKDDSFDHTLMKDSKKFHSKKKIEEVAKYIKEKSLCWSVTFEDEKVVDEINILQATQSSMHKSILDVIKKYNSINDVSFENKYQLLIDGNYFNPITIFNKRKSKIESISHITVEGGDNTYSSIAAASILAKVERDRYIDELCELEPTLSEYYGIDSNKGYGAKKHLDGIKEHGITKWHRKSFGICKKFA
jgi:ribonuclease HII